MVPNNGNPAGDGVFFRLYMQSEQLANTFKTIHAAVGVFITLLLTLLQAKYRKSSVSPFEAHGALMLLFTFAMFVYTVALLAVIILARSSQQQTEISYHLPTLNHISLFSGAIACGSLLAILAPPFGYVVFALSALVFVKILLGSYQELYKLLRHAANFSFNTVASLWIQMVFQLLHKVMHEGYTDAANFSFHTVDQLLHRVMDEVYTDEANLSFNTVARLSIQMVFPSLHRVMHEVYTDAANISSNTVARLSIQMVFQLLDKVMNEVATALPNARNSSEHPGSQAGISSEVTVAALAIARDSMV